MRFSHFFLHILILLLFICPVYTQDNLVQKSQEALLSDKIFEELQDSGLNPKVQLLNNSFSRDFPYNILLEFRGALDNNNYKKLVIVFPQNNTIFINDIINFANSIQNTELDYDLDILFSANDIYVTDMQHTESDIPLHTAEGSNTYIQNLFTNTQTASVIIPSMYNAQNETKSSDFSLFEDIVEITPGGITSTGNSAIVPLNFFTTVINSFAKSSVPYRIKGYFISLYQLNLITDDNILGAWLENDIPAIQININSNNHDNVFTMLNTLLDEFSTTNFSNQNTNYSFFHFFSQTFFITEQMLIVFLLIVSAVVLFGFFNFSFIRGKHKNIHKNELKKTWYLIPVIIIATGLSLTLSQAIIQLIIPNDTSFYVFSFAIKIACTILFMLIFSLLQYIVKLPLTGFIYAYTLSISAIINIILFSLVEITLAPLFVGQYIVVQISQRMRKVIPIILCFIIMTAPYIPLLFNIITSNEIFNIETMLHANFTMNILLACFMLPYQIMIIRILARLKVWGMKHKINRKKIIKQIITLVSLIIGIFIVSIIIIEFLKEDIPQNTENEKYELLISDSRNPLFGNIQKEISIFSNNKVIKYTIELQSENAIPIYDANFPYDILTKPFSAIFSPDDYPPNPLVLQVTTQNQSSINCKITAWIITDTGIKKIYREYYIQDET